MLVPEVVKYIHMGKTNPQVGATLGGQCLARGGHGSTVSPSSCAIAYWAVTLIGLGKANYLQEG